MPPLSIGILDDQTRKGENEGKSLRDKMLKDPHEDGFPVFKHFEVNIFAFLFILSAIYPIKNKAGKFALITDIYITNYALVSKLENW